jgi:hypothetical protein
MSRMLLVGERWQSLGCLVRAAAHQRLPGVPPVGGMEGDSSSVQEVIGAPQKASILTKQQPLSSTNYPMISLVV